MALFQLCLLVLNKVGDGLRNFIYTFLVLNRVASGIGTSFNTSLLVLNKGGSDILDFIYLKLPGVKLCWQRA